MRMDETGDAIAQAIANKSSAATGNAPVFGGERGLGGAGTRTSSSVYEEAFSAQGISSSNKIYTIPVWQRANVFEFGWKMNPDGSTVRDPEPPGSAADVRVWEAQQAGNKRRGGRKPDVKHFDEDSAKAEFGALLQNPDAVAAWAQVARAAGFIDADEMNDVGKLSEAWDKAIGLSFKTAKASGGLMLLTPFEMAQQIAENTGSGLLAQMTDAQRAADNAEKAKAYARAHFTGTRDLVTSTDVDTTAGTRNLENLRQLLGRNPTAGEKAAFLGGVNSVAAANPQVTKRSGRFEDGEQVTQKNTITGGIPDEAGVVRSSASSSSPEVDANQRATTYYNALTQAARAAI